VFVALVGPELDEIVFGVLIGPLVGPEGGALVFNVGDLVLGALAGLDV
jgi:hypothetical protein